MERDMSKRVVAVVGSYRKGGATESAVDAVLEGARARGAETRVFNLREKHIEFCTNCRACTQTPGAARVRCMLEDDLEEMLLEIEAEDAVVLASPVNYYNVTAIFRRFLERLLGFVYWPWGQHGPTLRTTVQPREAVLVATSAAPGFLIPLMTGAARALRVGALAMGARPVGTLWIGLTAGKAEYVLPERTRERARRMGMRLA
jgi:putative NADPH-quinone reductase